MAFDWTIRRKLFVLAAVAALGPLPIGAFGLAKLDAALRDGHEKAVQDVVTMARQAVDDLQGEVALGNLSEAEAKEAAKRLIRKVRYNDKGDYLFVYETDGTSVVLGPNPRLEGRNLLDLADPNGVRPVAQLIEAARNGGGFVEYHWERDGDLVPKTSYAEFDPEWRWMIGTGVYIDDVTAELQAAALRLGGILLVWGAVLALGVTALSRSINRPLAAVTDAMQAIADGALETAVPHAARRDEVGAVAGALGVFKERLIEQRGAADRLASAFEEQVGALLGGVTGLAASFEHESASVGRAAGETRDRATAGAGASTEASANVQAVAAASEEMSASIREISSRVVESRDMTTEASGASSRATASLEELRRRASEIDGFVETVSGIADQTNMLALNATIEAARAGEAGRGFAVVANEVKTLAGQTNKATADIAERVEALQTASARTEAELSSVGEVVSRLAEIATAIAAAMEEQSTVTDGIARNVQDAASGTESVNQAITHVADAAGRSNEAAARIAGSAADLARQAQALEGRVGAFLADLRAA